MASPYKNDNPVFLVFGKTGWIGGLLGELLKAQGAKFEYANARLEDRSAILADIERVGQMHAPAGLQHVLIAPFLTHRSSLHTC